MPLTCPSESELLLLALGDESLPGEATARHVRSCASCGTRLAGLRSLVAGVRASAGTTVSGDGACLDELALAEFVDGAGHAQRGARLSHLASCGHCRRQLAALLDLMADPGVAAEVRSLERPGDRPRARRRLLAWAGLAAAAAVVLVLVRPDGGSRATDAHRGPTITASAAPVPLAPLGDVAEVSVLRWTTVAGAERYRLTLFDAGGKVLFQGQGKDTVMALPDSVVVAPGRLYLWKVEARTGWDRWTSSELIEFRVGSGLAPSDTFLPSAWPPRGRARQPGQDSLRLLASRLSDSALIAEIRARPLGVRDALTETLARGELALAHRLAAAYAVAWHDEFLSRQVTRFSGWPPERRAAKVSADSLRRAGVAVFGRDGAAAAIKVWRRALAEANAIGDSAGAGATLGNIGAGLARDGRPDSAVVYLERSRALAVAVGDLRAEANAHAELAGVDESRGDVGGARQHYARAIALRTRIGDSRGLASDYNNLAGLAREAGDLDEARRHLEAALAINRQDGRAEVAATNLVNLAGLASLAGDFARGEALYRSAVATWRAREQWADMADALRGLGELEVRRGDYPAARGDLREALAIYDRTGPVADAFAVRQEMAGALGAEGELQGALDELRHARHLADSAGVAPGIQAGITLARADLAAQLNSRQEAERLYAAAELLFRRAGDRVGEAEAQEGRAVTLLDQDDAAAASPLLERALRIELATGNRRAASLTRLVLGDLSLRQADTAAARRQYARAAGDLSRLGDPVAAADAQGKRAQLEAVAGFPAAAESLYRSALASLGARIAPEVTWRLHAGLGTTLRDRGATDAAARELTAGIAAIEHTGRSLTLAERRSEFLTDKWDVFVQLALLERAQGRSEAAFEVSERMRANEMLELLAQGRVAAPQDTAAELVASEQDLRRRVGELTSELEGGAGGQSLRGPDVSRGSAVTREALLRAQESYAELLLEIRERAPRHAALVSPETASLHDVARALPHDEAFVEYLVSDASSLAFVVTRDTAVALQLGVGRRDLAGLIDFVRGSLQPRGAPSLDSLWRAPLRQLYRDLIAPVEATGFLAGKTRLTIVPHAELHYLPFAALLGGAGRERFLIERFQVMVAPSASVWLALGARPRDKASSGVLALAPRPDALPGSRAEVAAIGRLGGREAHVVIGGGATESAFRREAPTRRVIHLATYGVLNKQNPLFSFVALAPAGADDGRLEVHEVFGLRLAADLVVLSACQTGLGSGALTDVPAGDDWIGLSRAFLSAGAARVMATLWPVQDRASAALMERFYQEYEGGSDPGRALAGAQRALLAVPSTANPYYWAGFELVGGR